MDYQCLESTCNFLFTVLNIVYSGVFVTNVQLHVGPSVIVAYFGINRIGNSKIRRHPEEAILTLWSRTFVVSCHLL